MDQLICASLSHAYYWSLSLLHTYACSVKTQKTQTPYKVTTSKAMLYDKRQNYKDVEIVWPKKTWRKIVGGPLWDGEKETKNSGEDTGSTPAFSATHHAAPREVQVCTHSRVLIDRVRLPVLLVVN